MNKSRREFLQNSAFVSAALLASSQVQATERRLPTEPVIDTHQHLWDFSTVKPSWLKGASPALNRPMHHQEYREATQGLSIQAVYMEVDVDEDQLTVEAKHVLDLCERPTPTIAAVLGCRPHSSGFVKYLDQFRGNKKFKGVRTVLHSERTPPGFCLRPEFLTGIRELGKRNLMYDLCMRSKELEDGVKVAKECPETRFMLDHCGNANPKLFRKDASESEVREANDWKRAIEHLAACPNAHCKISGVIAQLPAGGDASDIAPIINHCLDSFGFERVVFGSDWPVCLLGAPLLTWVGYLTDIIASRKPNEQTALWSGNAKRIYTLSA